MDTAGNIGLIKDEILRIRGINCDPEKQYFDRYGGGYPNEVSVALIDAVYSVQSNYNTMSTRLKKLRHNLKELHGWENSLRIFCQASESDIVEAMGNNRAAPSSPRSTTKAFAALQVAKRLTSQSPETAPPLKDALPALDSAKSINDFLDSNKPTHQRNEKLFRKECKSVLGIGDVTTDYFLMNLGIQKVKADTMILRFIKRVTGTDVNTKEAAALITEAHHQLLSEERIHFDLLHCDNGIWAYERNLELVDETKPATGCSRSAKSAG
ncbi:hypothetical protein [Corynebacterium sp. H113]|uniref:hypothetical protein n=1 Tax=Corynebacterium sp. H113 TaxID=3133419 RepID=UPI0030A0EFE0